MVLGIDWQTIKAEFEFDGSWRDLSVLNANRETWQGLLDLLRSGPWPLRYTVDAEESDLPSEVTSLFSQGLDASVNLSIDVQGIRVNGHFFTKEEIEFDIDPREIKSEDSFHDLCKFIQWIGDGLGQNVILTPENDPSEVILRYLPTSGEFEHRPT